MKIVLSARMQMVADLVPTCKCVADVGCDHAYVSIYLVQNERAQCAIAMDVRKGPLSAAKEHIIAYGLAEQITCRLSDGLEKLEPEEADAVVIAGMGGPLMIDILEQGRHNCSGREVLILQPQSEIGMVRQYLHKRGYDIVEERMVIDMDKFYTVIKAVKQSNNLSCPLESTECEYTYGQYLLNHRDNILQEYLRREKEIQRKVYEHLEKNKTAKAKIRLEEIRHTLAIIKEAQAYYDIEGDNNTTRTIVTD